METPTSTNAAFDLVVSPILNVLSRDQAAQIVDFHADDALQTRIEELANKANEGELSPEELAEYEGYSQANRFIAVLQAKAKRLIDR